MGSLLASPRRRRRLARAAVVAGAGLAVTLSILFLRNTAPPHQQKFTKGRPTIAPADKTTRYSRHERASALTVASEFLQTAVRREHVGQSWSITDPELRSGYTRREWSRGNDLPFAPYHFSQVKVRPDYSYQDSVGYQVALFPDKTEHQRPLVFLLDLKRHGRGKAERWLVSYFEPAAVAGSTPPGVSNDGGGTIGGMRVTASPSIASDQSPLGAIWLLAPISLLSLILLVPIGLGIRGYLRNRRAMREYRRDTLRPLPRD